MESQYNIQSTYTYDICKNIINDIISNISNNSDEDIVQKQDSELIEVLNYSSSAQNIINTNTEDIKSSFENSDCSADDFDECYICNNPINPKTKDFKLKPFKLPCDCKHYTHAKCLIKWLKSKSKCPTCRYNFSDSEHNIEVSRSIRGHTTIPVLRTRNRFKKILQFMIVFLITFLRLYVIYMVLGKVGISFILVVFISYYAKKCYDNRAILPVDVVFRIPV